MFRIVNTLCVTRHDKKLPECDTPEFLASNFGKLFLNKIDNIEPKICNSDLSRRGSQASLSSEVSEQDGKSKTRLAAVSLTHACPPS